MQLATIREHLALFGGPKSGLRAFRRMLLYYARGLRGAAQFRVAATTMDDPAAVFEAVERFFSQAEVDGSLAADEDEDLEAALG